MSTNFILIVMLVSLSIGLAKGGVGGQAPVALLTPLMTFLMPAAQAVAIVLPLLLVGDVIALWLYWQKWDGRQIRLLLPMAVLGVVVGGVLLITLADAGQDTLLRRILGIFTLIVVIYRVSSNRLRTMAYEPRNWHGYVAGWVSGFGSALANVGAPAFTSYLLLQNVTPTTFVATSTLFFAIINALKLPITFRVLDAGQIASVLWAAPLIPISAWLGRRFVVWANPQVFEWSVLILLFIIGLFMLLVTPGG